MRALVGALLLLATLGAQAGTATLTWSKLAQNCDGTSATITGYRVYWGLVGRAAAGLPLTSAGGCSDVSQIAPNNPKVAVAYPNASVLVADPNLTTAITLPNDGKRYYFAVTQVSAQGESNLTNEVSKLADAAPAAPTFNPSVCPTCTQLTGAQVWFGTTGQPITVKWTAQAVSVVVSVFEYPPKAGAAPVTQATLAPAVVQWNWVPLRAGTFYTRVCAGALCTDSYAQAGLVNLYSLKLAAPTGGGIN